MPVVQTLNSRYLPAWAQYGGVVIAGAASFWLAMQWGQGESKVDSGIELRKTNRTGNPAISPLLSLSPQSIDPSVDPSPRLDPGMRQNPFGPLNLLASVDRPAAVLDPSPDDTVRPASGRKIKSPPVVAAAPAVPEPLTPVSEAPPAPAPEAPVLPFIVTGAIQGQRIGDGTPMVFLKDSAELLVVRAGDEIRKTYRVKSITDDKIEFIYLPLQKLQSLSLSR